MSKIFISFLGTGAPAAVPGYQEVSYCFEESEMLYTSRFAQRAIIEKHQAGSFDKVCLLMTPESRDKHRDLLHAELIVIGCDPETIIEDDSITTKQNTEEQWKWFDSLQKLIEDGDEVIFDFTHGFRSVPIIFSTAISFLQKVKQFELLHAYYGFVDGGKGQIIDMAKFYRINEWADGVARLVDMADASKLAELAEEGKADGFAALNDPKLTQALRELTDLIKNIDVNNVGKKADEALKLIGDKKKSCTGADAQLLEMVVQKFTKLANQGSGRYDYKYFQLQLTLSEMLLKHGLNMQAFTVMREAIASIGMLSAKGDYRNPTRAKDARGYRESFGEIFIGLCSIDRSKWREENAREAYGEQQQYKLRYFDEMILPFYERLEEAEIINGIQWLSKEIKKVRNGFNHAWVSKAAVDKGITIKGKDYLEKLSGVIEKLNDQGFLKDQ